MSATGNSHLEPNSNRSRRPSLHKLLLEHEGKVTDKWSSYVDRYQALADSLHCASSVLEIGVQNGGSLEIWSRLFPEADVIIGCDIDVRCGLLTFDDPRIRVVCGDATSLSTRESIQSLCANFDLIIDDGSHKSEDIIGTFEMYFGLLRPGGYYVVEDLACSYWESHGGGLHNPDAAMSFFKKLVDVQNAQHWELELKVLELLGTDPDREDLATLEEDLRRIDSISFYNSLCVVGKAARGYSSIGLRVVRGSERSVDSLQASMDGSCIQPPDQTASA